MVATLRNLKKVDYKEKTDVEDDIEFFEMNISIFNKQFNKIEEKLNSSNISESNLFIMKKSINVINNEPRILHNLLDLLEVNKAKVAAFKIYNKISRAEITVSNKTKSKIAKIAKVSNTL